MDFAASLSFLLVVTGLSLAAGFLLGRLFTRPAPADSRLEIELRSQVTAQADELRSERAARRQADEARAKAEAEAQAVQGNLAEACKLHEEQTAALRREHERGLAQLREAFSALGTDALQRLQPQFLEHAAKVMETQQERAKSELAQRQEAIAALLKPMEELLRTYQSRLAQSETTQSNALGEVKRHVEILATQSSSLSAETMQLRRILSSNQARGRWGEETLRRVVEASGMSVHCDFAEQAHGEESKPDLIVRLPGNRVIVVDSKVPDLEFLDALPAADDATRAELLAQHAAKLHSTMKALAERDYPAQFPQALDHVVLFLPAESLFSSALEGDPGLIFAATKRRIMLATPTSLIALLRSVSISWQQHERTKNERAIAETAQELYGRVATFVRHLEGLRAGLAKANDAFNDAVGSYERSVRPSGERLLRMGVSNGGKALGELPILAEPLREMRSALAEGVTETQA
jgi:DNA recombination protein RmuC